LIKKIKIQFIKILKLQVLAILKWMMSLESRKREFKKNWFKK